MLYIVITVKLWKISKYRNYLQFSFLEGKMTISIDGFMVCVYISEDILMHTKYIFILKQEYIAIPVGDNWKGTGYLRIYYLEAMFSQSIPSSYQESALKHYPETAVVTPFWKDSAFQLLHMEATLFDRLLFAQILTADIQPSDRKGLDWIKRSWTICIVTVHQQIQALSTISISILNCSRTMGKSLSLF